MHVHTTFSDGGGTPEEAVVAAKAAGLDWVILTDHNNLDAKPVEGYRDGVLVLVGTEVSTNAGHILGLGIPDPRFRFSGDALDALQDIRNLGGFAFTAHPETTRADFRFSGWDLPGAWGLEVLNGDSEWRRASFFRLLRTATVYGLNSRYALLSTLTPPDALLERWDALLAQRDVSAIIGADAHSRIPITDGLALRFPSYASVFALAQNHVLLDRPLTGDARADGAAVLASLSRGRAYIGLDALAPAGGFYFVAEQGERRFTMGDSVPAHPPPRLRAGGQMPRGARIRLIRDGKEVAESEGRLELASADAGVYRVEVRVPGWKVPWIFSNGIYVIDETSLETRRRAAEWPPPGELPKAVEVIDSFDGKTVFEGGFDPSSTMERGILESGAARLKFKLGFPTPETPSPFCAIVSWAHRDLSSRQGLVFSIRGDDVYRVWVQVRDENPPCHEGMEWWFASVKTATDWRRVFVPFSRLRSEDPCSDGRLDLNQVRALVFVIDIGAVKPGTEGTLWIDDLGVY